MRDAEQHHRGAEAATGAPAAERRETAPGGDRVAEGGDAATVRGVREADGRLPPGDEQGAGTREAARRLDQSEGLERDEWRVVDDHGAKRSADAHAQLPHLHAGESLCLLLDVVRCESFHSRCLSSAGRTAASNAILVVFCFISLPVSWYTRLLANRE